MSESNPKTRGSHSSRPRRAVSGTNSTLDEESRILKSKFSDSLNSLEELFPDWKEEDLLAVLAETDGSIEEAVIRITEGHASQWGEVKKKTKERAKSKGPADVPHNNSNTENDNKPASASSRQLGTSSKSSRGAKSERGRSRAPKRTNGSTHATTPAAPQAVVAQNPTTTPGSWSDSSASTGAITTGSVPASSSSSARKTWADALSTKHKPAATPVPSSTQQKAPTTNESNELTSVPASVELPVIAAPSIIGNTSAPASTSSTPVVAAPVAASASVTSPVAPTAPAASTAKPKMSWAAIATPKPPPTQPKKITEPHPTQQQQIQSVKPTVPVSIPLSVSKEDTASTTSAIEPANASISVENSTQENINKLPSVPTSATVEGVLGTPTQPPGLDKSSSSNASDTAPSSLGGNGSVSSQPSLPRRLNKDVPVVLPGSVSSRIDHAGVQFGSLNLADNDDGLLDEEIKEEAVTPQVHAQSQQQHQQQLQATQQAQAQQQYQSSLQAQQQQAQQQQQAYYNRYGQQPQQQPAQQLQQSTAAANQQQQKPFEASIAAQNQYVYPGSHPGFAGYSAPSDYQSPYGANDPQRNSYANYYTPYQQQAQHQHLHHDNSAGRGGAATSLDQNGAGVASRYGSEAATSTTGATPSSVGANSSVTGQSPATSTVSPGVAAAAPQGQYQQHSMNPYYMSPAYAAYYYQSYGYTPQAAAAAAAQYGNAGPQKSFFNQQQSYYDHYRQQQPPSQGQQGGPQSNIPPQGPQQQQLQQQVGQPSNTLSGISDFLHREDTAKGSPGSPQGLTGQTQLANNGQQQHPQQVQGPPQGQPQYPVQQNLYTYAGYGHYGQQGGRQGWGYGN